MQVRLFWRHTFCKFMRNAELDLYPINMSSYFFLLIDSPSENLVRAVMEGEGRLVPSVLNANTRTS